MKQTGTSHEPEEHTPKTGRLPKNLDAQTTQILGHAIIGNEIRGLKGKMRARKRRK